MSSIECSDMHKGLSCYVMAAFPKGGGRDDIFALFELYKISTNIFIYYSYSRHCTRAHLNLISVYTCTEIASTILLLDHCIVVITPAVNKL